MRRVALKGIFGRKLRTALTAFSVVLGVAMVTGSFVLTDTMSKAFDSIFSSSYAETDVVVSGRSLVDWSDQGNALVSDELLRQVRALPSVEEASGSILDLNSSANTAHLIDTEGEIVTGNGNPTFGLGRRRLAAEFNPLTIVEGEFADEPGEVVVDASSADRLGYHVGSPISIEVGGPVHEFELVGVAKFGDVDTIGERDDGDLRRPRGAAAARQGRLRHDRRRRPGRRLRPAADRRDRAPAAGERAGAHGRGAGGRGQEGRRGVRRTSSATRCSASV